MQIQPLLSLAACALTLGAAAAQSAPRVLAIDELPAAEAGVRVLAATPATPAVPGAVARVATRAQEGASQQRAYLGVSLTDAEGGGASVSSVVSGSPAERAKLKAGDVVVSVDGSEIQDSAGLVDAVRSKKAGATVKLQVRRGDERFEREAVLGTTGVAVETPDAEPPAIAPHSGGVWIAREAEGGEPHTIELRQLDIDPMPEGVIELEGPDGNAKGRSVQIFRNLAGAGAEGDGGHGEGAQEHRVEVRAEAKSENGGKPEVKVWVNGKEIDGHAALEWVGDLEGIEIPEGAQLRRGLMMGDGGPFRVQFEGDEDGERRVSLRVLDVDGGSMDSGGRYVVRLDDGGGSMDSGGHAGPRGPISMMAVGGSSELQRRVKELEGQVERMQKEIAELKAALGQRPAGVRAGTLRRLIEDDLRLEAAEAPAAAEGPVRIRARRVAPGSLGADDFFIGINEGRAETATKGVDVPAPKAKAERAPKATEKATDKKPAQDPGTEELRKEIRDLMRAIERLEQRTGGGGGR